MAARNVTEEDITARARKLADEQGPGWEAVLEAERVGKDTAALRHWRQLAVKELEAEDATVLEVEADASKTIGLE